MRCLGLTIAIFSFYNAFIKGVTQLLHFQDCLARQWYIQKKDIRTHVFSFSAYCINSLYLFFFQFLCPFNLAYIVNASVYLSSCLLGVLDGFDIAKCISFLTRHRTRVYCRFWRIKNVFRIALYQRRIFLAAPTS